MSYFREISEYATYSGSEADFHFIYNANSGGGQAFLAGRFYDAEGALCSPESLNGKTAIFKCCYTTYDGETKEIILDDEKSKYEIKPRGAGSTSMKLGVGTDRIAPSKIVSAFMMLPPTCGVKTPGNLSLSILTSGNYWLQSMWLKCDTVSETPSNVFLVISDFVFSGGANKESATTECRYFTLDFTKRINDVIELSTVEGIFSDEISSVLRTFADIYSGQSRFSYSVCEQAVKTLMIQLAKEYPSYYSGISDPLHTLSEIVAAKKASALDCGEHTDNNPKTYSFNTGYASGFARNRILFGAPGTGKSYTLNEDRKELIYGDRTVDEDKIDLSLYGEYERVTFHPDYSYAGFVGTYKPIPCKDSDGKDAITYSYVPGPFMRTYVKALKNSRTDNPKPYLLIIEEINRANVAAVFGDVFQLLDRRADEVSEYPIQASEDIKKFLASPEQLGGDPSDYEEIRIPDNMFIWATMNSADQGVFPLDTAFKRRWDFTYLGIDESESGIAGKTVILGTGEYRRRVEWNALRKAINEELLTYKVNEDKLMGPYFISKKALSDSAVIDPNSFIQVFKNKVLMYLFDDAAKQKRDTLFDGCDAASKRQYSKICREFDIKGVSIFRSTISSQFIDIPGDDGE